MKPPPFRYLAPRTLDDAVSLLAEHGRDAKVLAGGQSLVPQLNLRAIHPGLLVDINRVEGLDRLDADNGTVRVGALVRQHAVERSPLVRERVPLLAEATGFVGHLAVRHRGTVAGSVAFADPAAELPATMLALDASLVARGPGGERVIRAEEFFAGAFATTLAPDELLTELRIPATGERTGGAFVEFARRDQDLPVCGVAAVLRLDGDGRCARARVALCGVGATPVRAASAEQALEGQAPDAAVIAGAADQAAAGLDPPDAASRSAAYRRRLAAVLTRRALEQAAARARGETQG